MTLPDVDDFETMGGALKNYAPVTDPECDEDAVHRNRYVANVAMLTQTGPRAIVTFAVGDAGEIVEPDDFAHAAMWGRAPRVKPASEAVDVGHYRFTWPSIVDTPLTRAPLERGGGKSIAINFRAALAFVDFADVTGAPPAVCARVVAPNVVDVFVRDGAAAADVAGARVTVVVF